MIPDQPEDLGNHMLCNIRWFVTNLPSSTVGWVIAHGAVILQLGRFSLFFPSLVSFLGLDLVLGFRFRVRLGYKVRF